MDPKIEQRLQAVEKYIEERKRQQITYPLDVQSQIVLQKYFMTIVDNLWYTSAGGNLFKELVINQGDRANVVSARPSLITYSADVSSDTLILGQDIINLKQGAFSDDQQVSVIAGGAVAPGGDPPTPLTTSGIYYVVNASAGGTIIQLSLTLGGAAINLTDNGTGQQYIYFVT